MAQKIQPVPNPLFTVSALNTIAGTIVARRRIKIPVSNTTPSFSGVRNSSAFTTQSYAYFDIADNESFLDLRKMVLVMDLTFHTYQQLAPCFDQNSQALIAQFAIGTSQGVKLEEIQKYNLLTNIVNCMLQPAHYKERNLLDYSDFNKSNIKVNGLHHLMDSTYYMYGQSAITPEHPYRIHLRIHQSSLIDNMVLCPLFLFRNGIRFEFMFESVYKAFYLGTSLDPARESVYPASASNLTVLAAAITADTIRNFWTSVNWFVAPGAFDYAGASRINSANILIPAAGAILYYGSFQVPSNAANPNVSTLLSPSSCPVAGSTTCYARACYNILWVNLDIALSKMGRFTIGRLSQAGSKIDAFYCVPVRFFHQGRLMWSGVSCIHATQLPNVYFSKNETVLTSTGNNTLTTNNSLVGQVSDNNAGAFAFVVGGTTYGSATHFNNFFGFPLYSWNPEDTPPYMTFGNSGSEPTISDILKALITSGAECAIAWDDAFWFEPTVAAVVATGSYLNSNGISTSVMVLPSITGNQQARFINPMISLWVNNSLSNVWTYELKNLEMILDLVKPAADDFQKFQMAYYSESGIPYKYKKTIYRKTTFSPVSGVYQLGLHLSVRSMTGLLMVFQDPKCDLEPSDSTKFQLPCLSSFMRKGLTKAEVVVGGQVYPIYPMYMRPDVLTYPSYGEEHLLESECFFGTANNASFNPSVSLTSTKYSRNYLTCGNFDQNAATKWGTNFLSGADVTITNIPTQRLGYKSNIVTSTSPGTGGVWSVPYSEPFPILTGPSYLESSSFILGWSLSKEDNLNFGTGLDTSMSGQVNVNLYFADSGYKDFNTFFVDVHTFVTCDAIATIQNDATLVRI